MHEPTHVYTYVRTNLRLQHYVLALRCQDKKHKYKSTPNVLLTRYFHPQDVSFKEVTDLLQQKTHRQYTYFYVNGSYIGDNYQWSQSPYNGATLTLPR